MCGEAPPNLAQTPLWASPFIGGPISNSYFVVALIGNLCGTSTQPQASAQAALKQWKAAGFPASKVMLFYAHHLHS